MSDQFICEIRMVACNFAPVGWAFCDGQLLSISQNTALFSLLGTQFGGNGISTFGLPNLQGAMPLGYGSGPALTPRNVGDAGGEQTVLLLPSQIPQHTHAAQASTAGGVDVPSNAVWGESKLGKTPLNIYAASGANNVPMNPGALATYGGSQPHNNLPPYQCLNFIIALTGIFPSRA